MIYFVALKLTYFLYKGLSSILKSLLEYMYVSLFEQKINFTIQYQLFKVILILQM